MISDNQSLKERGKNVPGTKNYSREQLSLAAVQDFSFFMFFFFVLFLSTNITHALTPGIYLVFTF